MNEKERLLSFLGIARRAQKLSMGADAAQEAMQKGKTKLLLLASDLSERSERSARAAAQPTIPPPITSTSGDSPSSALSRMTGSGMRCTKPLSFMRLTTPRYLFLSTASLPARTIFRQSSDSPVSTIHPRSGSAQKDGSSEASSLRSFLRLLILFRP